MRLTLRTLLAYLDDILEEQDAEELKDKIDESEVATQLVQRIGQVGQKKLDAPHISIEGIGADANSVAEYLDNTLPAEQVPDFEQVCLDSDMHLGEVAACHQILTLVLGEPAEISPRLKESIHRIGSADPIEGETPPEDLDRDPIPSVTREPGATPAHEVHRRDPIAKVDAADAIPVPKRDADEHWTKAPDYLVKRRRSLWKPVGIAALILICLVIAGLTATGPLSTNHPLAQLVLGTEVDEQPGDDDLDIPETTLPPFTEDLPGEQDIESTEPPSDSLPPDNDPIDDASSDQPASDQVPIDLPPLDPGPAETPFTDVTEETVVDSADGSLPDDFDVADGPDVPEPSVDDIAATSLPDALPAEPTTIEPVLPPDPPVIEQPDSVQPDPNQSEGIVPVFTNTNNDTDENAATDPVEPTDVAEGPREIGRYLSEDQVLARFNPTDETWQSVAPRESFMENDVLMAFPIFRPQMMLATGMQVTLAGPARIQLLALGEGDSPNLKLDFGRATIVTFAQSGMTIGIAWGTQTATVTLDDTSSTFAIEVDRRHPYGADLETERPHSIVRVIATSGGIQWQMGGAESIAMVAGQQLLIIDESVPQIIDGAEDPLWIDGRDARPIDPIAVRKLKPFLTQDRPISLSLREQADSKRLELRSLAVCSLAYLGEFDPLLVALNDDRWYSYWTSQYRVLQHTASLDNEIASRVRQAIEARHGDEGQQLFRMLRGYSPAQLAEGGAQTLVDYLDHPSSDFRVAAIENLKEITGIPSLYMPRHSERERRKHIVTWRNRLNKGQIKYRDPPALLQPDDAPVEP